jgi:hypothetical protein
MEYYKLLEDFLNKDRDDRYYTVGNWENRGSYVEVYVQQWNENTNIDMFDLMVFVYTKQLTT